MLKLFKTGLAVMLALFTFNTSAAVIGNASIDGNYGKSITIEIELFNLYDNNARDVSIKITDLVNVDKNSDTHNPKFKESFLKSSGLGWVTIVLEEPVYSGIISFTLEVVTTDSKAKRRYTLKPYGRALNRPIKTCPIKSKRMKCATSAN